MAYSLSFPIDPKEVLVVGTGGDSRERSEYRDGEATGRPLLHSNGSSIRGLSGVSVSVSGQGLDGAVVTTTTPIESVPAGTIFRASGEVKLTVRADARVVGRGSDARARGDVVAQLFVEQIEPVGDVNDLLAKGPASSAKSSESRAS